MCLSPSARVGGAYCRFWDDGDVELTPFRIERWYERYEFTTELMLSSSDCESVSVGELLALEPDARERLASMQLGYTEVPGSEELRSAIAALYTRAGPEDVVALAAAEEGIFAVEHALLGPGDHAVVETPCYESALAVARSTGADVDAWRRSYADGWAHDLEELERLLRPDTTLVYVNTPHNPTGTSMPHAVLDRVVELCAERGTVLLCDEVYRELEHDPACRLPAACDRYERAISLGSVSKTYGLPGLRTGWVACRDGALRDAIVAVEALHDDLLERPERAARRARAAPPGRARRAEPLAGAREPRARRRVRRAARRVSWTGCVRRRPRSAFRACASTTRRRSASASPPTRACSSSRARSTTSPAMSASASVGSARRRRSSASTDSSAAG